MKDKVAVEFFPSAFHQVTDVSFYVGMAFTKTLEIAAGKQKFATLLHGFHIQIAIAEIGPIPHKGIRLPEDIIFIFPMCGAEAGMEILPDRKTGIDGDIRRDSV